jgi:hypothetical protein
MKKGKHHSLFVHNLLCLFEIHFNIFCSKFNVFYDIRMSVVNIYMPFNEFMRETDV